MNASDKRNKAVGNANRKGARGENVTLNTKTGSRKPPVNAPKWAMQLNQPKKAK